MLGKNVLLEVHDLTALQVWCSEHWINVFAFLKQNGWRWLVASRVPAMRLLRVKIVKAPLLS